MRYLLISFLLISAAVSSSVNAAEDTAKKPAQEEKYEYAVGIGDILEIAVLQPEKMALSVTVSPDGSITYPYIGQVAVKGLGLAKIQQDIQARLADGYMKYPVISVSLKESRSRKFLVYGEVARPGEYFLDENTTVLKAISMAGGFTKFGSSSGVKILRPRTDKPGYEPIKVKIKSVMKGDAKADIILKSGDMVVVSEGVF